MSNKALVTGAAGFIGKHVVQTLLDAGWDVEGYDLSPKPRGLECAWQTADILDEDVLAKAMRGKTTVFHLAARAHLFAHDPAIFETINHQGTRTALRAARAAGVEHLMVTLSAAALTPIGFKGQITAQMPRPPIKSLAGPYAASKWRADQALDDVDASDLRVTRLFPTVPIGPGDNAFTAPTQMIRMFVTKPPPAILQTTLNLVPVQDIAAAHLRAAERADTGQTNQDRRYLLAGERWPLSELLVLLESKTGKAMPNKQIPYGAALMAACISEPLARLRRKDSLATREGVRLASADPIFDTTYTQTMLDWHPAAIEPALDALLAWLDDPS
jgi:dihydroflavonol-4-reductase